MTSTNKAPGPADLAEQMTICAKELQELQLALHGGPLDKYRLALCVAAKVMQAVGPNRTREIAQIPDEGETHRLIERLVNRAAFEANYLGGPLEQKYRGERKAAQWLLEEHLGISHPHTAANPDQSGKGPT